jgi:hypothetical protein
LLQTLAEFANVAIRKALLIISGIAQGISLIDAREVPHFWLQLVLLSVIVGVLLIRHRGSGLLAITLLLVVYFMVEGVSKVIFSLTIRPFPNWGWVLISGIGGEKARGVQRSCRTPKTRNRAVFSRIARSSRRVLGHCSGKGRQRRGARHVTQGQFSNQRNRHRYWQELISRRHDKHGAIMLRKWSRGQVEARLGLIDKGVGRIISAATADDWARPELRPEVGAISASTDCEPSSAPRGQMSLWRFVAIPHPCCHP